MARKVEIVNPKYLEPIIKHSLKDISKKNYLYGISKYVKKYGDFDPEILKKFKFVPNSLIFSLSRKEIDEIIDTLGKKSIEILVSVVNPMPYKYFKEKNYEDLIVDPTAHTFFSFVFINNATTEIHTAVRVYRSYKEIIDKVMNSVDEKIVNIIHMYHTFGMEWMDEVKENINDPKVKNVIINLLTIGPHIYKVFKNVSIKELTELNVNWRDLRKMIIRFNLNDKEFTKEEAINFIHNFSILTELLTYINLEKFMDCITLPPAKFYNVILMKHLTGELDENNYESLIKFAYIAAGASEEDIKFLEKHITVMRFRNLPNVNVEIIKECIKTLNLVNAELLNAVMAFGIETVKNYPSYMSLTDWTEILSFLAKNGETDNFTIEFLRSLESEADIKVLNITVDIIKFVPKFKAFLEKKGIRPTFINIYMARWCLEVYGEDLWKIIT